MHLICSADILAILDRVTLQPANLVPNISEKVVPNFPKSPQKLVSSKSSDMLLTHVALSTQTLLTKSAGIVFKYEYDDVNTIMISSMHQHHLIIVFPLCSYCHGLR